MFLAQFGLYILHKFWFFECFLLTLYSKDTYERTNEPRFGKESLYSCCIHTKPFIWCYHYIMLEKRNLEKCFEKFRLQFMWHIKWNWGWFLWGFFHLYFTLICNRTYILLSPLKCFFVWFFYVNILQTISGHYFNYLKLFTFVWFAVASWWKSYDID